MPPWSSGLGHRPLTAATGVRIPLEVPSSPVLKNAGLLLFFEHLAVNGQKRAAMGRQSCAFAGDAIMQHEKMPGSAGRGGCQVVAKFIYFSFRALYNKGAPNAYVFQVCCWGHALR